MLSALSRRTGRPQLRQHSSAARANSSFRWSLSSVIVPTVERDRRRNTADRLHLWLVHAIEELSRVRREGLDVAPLTLGIERVEHERRLPRSRDSGDDDQLIEREVEIEILEIVLARATHADGVAGGVSHSVTVHSG